MQLDKSGVYRGQGFKDYLDKGGWMGPEAGRRWTQTLAPCATHVTCIISFHLIL